MKQITLRLQYPKELAPVSECELDGLLAALQSDQTLWDYEMTLGAEITEGTTAVEGTDGASHNSHQSQPRGLVGIVSVEGNTVAKNYYCRTAPRYKSGSGTVASANGACPKHDDFTPTILVEMFANISIPDEAPVVGAIRDCIMRCLKVNEKLSVKPNFRFMKYSTGTPQPKHK